MSSASIASRRRAWVAASLLCVACGGARTSDPDRTRTGSPAATDARELDVPALPELADGTVDLAARSRVPTKRELAARRRPHDEAEPPFGASDWPFEGCPIDPNVDGARREAAVERHSGCVRVRLIGSFEPRVSLHFDFRPTRLTRGAAGELFVAGRTTDGRACIELLRFPTAAHDGVVALEPNARVRVLTEPVGGGRDVRWFRASETSNGARLLFQFVDADTFEELDVVTGTRRVLARSSLVKRGLVLRGVVDRMGGGVWHVLQSAVATPPDRISVLLLIDENRDGAIDDACEVTAGAARFAGVELHLSDGEPIGQY